MDYNLAGESGTTPCSEIQVPNSPRAESASKLEESEQATEMKINWILEGGKELNKKKARRSCCTEGWHTKQSRTYPSEPKSCSFFFYNKNALSSPWVWDQMKCNEGNKNISYYTSGIKAFISYF